GHRGPETPGADHRRHSQNRRSARRPARAAGVGSVILAERRPPVIAISRVSSPAKPGEAERSRGISGFRLLTTDTARLTPFNPLVSCANLQTLGQYSSWHLQFSAS